MRRVTHSHGLTPFKTPLPGSPALQPHRGAAVPSYNQFWCQSKFPGSTDPWQPSSAASPRAHLLTDCAAPGVGRTRSRGAPGCAGTGQVEAGEPGCRIRRRRTSSVEQSGAAGRTRSPYPAGGEGSPRGERWGPAAHRARLLNESPAQRGELLGPAPYVRPLAPPPTSESRPAASQRLARRPPAGRGLTILPPGPAALHRHLSGLLGTAGAARGDRDTFRTRPFEGAGGGAPNQEITGLCFEAKRCLRFKRYSGTAIIGCVTRATATTSWEFSFFWNWLPTTTTSVSCLGPSLASGIAQLVSKRVCKKCSPSEFLWNLAQIPPLPE